MATTNTVYRRNIKRGMALLDEKQPDWIQRINIRSLNISSCTYCTLGQVYGDYGRGLDLLEFAGHDARPYGFASYHKRESPRLTILWREAIVERRGRAEYEQFRALLLAALPQVSDDEIAVWEGFSQDERETFTHTYYVAWQNTHSTLVAGHFAAMEVPVFLDTTRDIDVLALQTLSE